jgi:hypothetical protein
MSVLGRWPRKQSQIFIFKDPSKKVESTLVDEGANNHKSKMVLTELMLTKPELRGLF